MPENEATTNQEPANALDQLYYDIFTTALEGGIEYWADVLRYNHTLKGVPDLRTFNAEIIEEDKNEDQSLMVTRDIIVQGMAMVLEGSAGPKQQSVARYCMAHLEDADFDVDLADAVVQMGLFYTIVYA